MRDSQGKPAPPGELPDILAARMRGQADARAVADGDQPVPAGPWEELAGEWDRRADGYAGDGRMRASRGDEAGARAYSARASLLRQCAERVRAVAATAPATADMGLAAQAAPADGTERDAWIRYADALETELADTRARRRRLQDGLGKMTARRDAALALTREILAHAEHHAGATGLSSIVIRDWRERAGLEAHARGTATTTP